MRAVLGREQLRLLRNRNEGDEDEGNEAFYISGLQGLDKAQLDKWFPEIPINGSLVLGDNTNLEEKGISISARSVK